MIISQVLPWISQYLFSIDTKALDEQTTFLENDPNNNSFYLSYARFENMFFEIFLDSNTVYLLISYVENDEVIFKSSPSVLDGNFTQFELFSFLNRNTERFQQTATLNNCVQSTNRKEEISNALKGKMIVRYGLQPAETQDPSKFNKKNLYTDQVVVIPNYGSIEVLNSSVILKDHHNKTIEEESLVFVYHEISHTIVIGLINVMFNDFIEFYTGKFNNEIENRKSYCTFGENVVVELTYRVIDNGFSPKFRYYNYLIAVLKGVFNYFDYLAVLNHKEDLVSIIIPEIEKLNKEFRSKYITAKEKLANYIESKTEFDSDLEFHLNYDHTADGVLIEMLNNFTVVEATKFILASSLDDYNSSKSYDISSYKEEIHNRYRTRNLCEGDFLSYSEQIIDGFKIWYKHLSGDNLLGVNNLINNLPSDYNEFISNVFSVESLKSGELVLNPFSSEFLAAGGIDTLF